MTSSQLHIQVEDYLRLRRSLGFKLVSAGVLLASLVRHAEQVGHQGPLTTQLAVAWAQQTASEHPATAAQRLAVVRVFARHQAALDSVTEIPPEGILGDVSRRRSQPHIYSDDEIGMLLDQCRQLTPRGGLRPAVTSLTCSHSAPTVMASTSPTSSAKRCGPTSSETPRPSPGDRSQPTTPARSR